MPVNVPSRNALVNRQARPLTGKEVADAIENHLLILSTKLIDGAGLLSDEMSQLQEALKEDFRLSLHYQSRLHKLNVTYPKVGWSIKLRLEESEEDHKSRSMSADLEIDLERNLRLNVRVGRSCGLVLSSIEEEKIPNNVPDQDRDKFKLPVTADFIKDDGTVGRVDVKDLQPKERRAARTVDVGSGAPNREVRPLPSQNDAGQIVTRDVLMTGGQQGEEVVTPAQLADKGIEVTLDLVAEPPTIDKAPPVTPLPPPNTMSQVHRPNVKFKK